MDGPPLAGIRWVSGRNVRVIVLGTTEMRVGVKKPTGRER